MNSLDARTIFMLTGVLGGLMSIVLFALARNFPPSIRGLNHWATALLVFFLGGVMASQRDKVPDLFGVMLPNLSIWGGGYLVYHGFQLFFREKTRPAPWIGVIAAVAAVAAWYTWRDPSYVARLRLSNVLMFTYFAFIVALVLRQGKLTLGKSLALVVLVMIASAQLGRFVTSFFVPIGQSNLSVQDPIQLAFITVWAVSVLLISVAMVLMATEKLRLELEQLATRDSLTNALTRRHWNILSDSELQRCKRTGRDMAILALDLDHFKSVNDTYGHAAGDKVLVEFVARVNSHLRQNDQLARFGGEEFLLLLPETSLEQAILVAERIRADLAKPASGPTCTVSVGVATRTGDTDTVDAIIARADTAMYRAKAAGRNRVEHG